MRRARGGREWFVRYIFVECLYNDSYNHHGVAVVQNDKYPPAPPALTHRVSLCDHTRLDNGIHKLVIKRASRPAVDDWIAVIDGIFEGTSDSSPTVRFLVDSTVGVLPMGYVSMRIRDLMRKYPTPPRIRYVNLLTNYTLVGLINSIVHVLRIPRLKIQSMHLSQEAEAIAWLLLDD
jgi:hypothetical protein